jgi:hypothetical protein
MIVLVVVVQVVSFRQISCCVDHNNNIATEENRQVAPAKCHNESSVKVINMNVAQHNPEEFRTLPAEQVQQACGLRTRTERTNKSDSSPAQKQISGPIDDSLSQPYPSIQSLLSPIVPLHSDASDGAWSPSKGLDSTDPLILTHHIIPQSPYDPLLTPSFRHSSPRLPSDQPWRFPSPSHPLYSKQHDLCLTMLAPQAITPLTKCGSPASTSLIRTPLLSIPSVSVFGKDQLVDIDLPETKAEFESPLFSKSSFLAANVTNIEMNGFQADESPLSRCSRRPTAANDKSHSKLPLVWPDDECTAIDGQGILHDPFADIYSSWVDLGTNGNDIVQESCPSAVSSAEAESPVMRSSALPTESSSESSLFEFTRSDVTFPISEGDFHDVSEDSHFTLMWPSLEHASDVGAEEVQASPSPPASGPQQTALHIQTEGAHYRKRDIDSTPLVTKKRKLS